MEGYIARSYNLRECGLFCRKSARAACRSLKPIAIELEMSTRKSTCVCVWQIMTQWPNLCAFCTFDSEIQPRAFLQPEKEYVVCHWIKAEANLFQFHVASESSFPWPASVSVWISSELDDRHTTPLSLPIISSQYPQVNTSHAPHWRSCWCAGKSFYDLVHGSC